MIHNIQNNCVESLYERLYFQLMLNLMSQLTVLQLSARGNSLNISIILFCTKRQKSTFLTIVLIYLVSRMTAN
jgi:hypothetical protein